MKHLLFALFMLCFVSVLTAQDGNFHLDKTYPIGTTGVIDLRCSDAKVFITGSSRKDVHLKIERKVTTKGWSATSGNFSVDVEAEAGNLNIHERQSGANMSVTGYYKEDYRIDIEAPEGVSLTIRGDDGDQFIKNISVSTHGPFKSLKQSEEFTQVSLANGEAKVSVTADDASVKLTARN